MNENETYISFSLGRIVPEFYKGYNVVNMPPDISFFLSPFIFLQTTRYNSWKIHNKIWFEKIVDEMK